MYTYRERIVHGETECSVAQVDRILRELSREWSDHSYDLLSRNCNHFFDVLCDMLGAPKLPGNRVAFRTSEQRQPVQRVPVGTQFLEYKERMTLSY
jgi:hypothetical protein